MKVVKHKLKLPIINLDKTVTNSKELVRKHGLLFPNTIRCLICGPSNCGKSNVMLSLIFEKMDLSLKTSTFIPSLYINLNIFI